MIKKDIEELRPVIEGLKPGLKSMGMDLEVMRLDAALNAGDGDRVLRVARDVVQSIRDKFAGAIRGFDELLNDFDQAMK